MHFRAIDGGNAHQMGVVSTKIFENFVRIFHLIEIFLLVRLTLSSSDVTNATRFRHETNLPKITNRLVRRDIGLFHRRCTRFPDQIFVRFLLDDVPKRTIRRLTRVRRDDVLPNFVSIVNEHQRMRRRRRFRNVKIRTNQR